MKLISYKTKLIKSKMLILLIEFISFMDEKMCLALNKKPGKFYYCTQKYFFIIFLFHGPIFFCHLTNSSGCQLFNAASRALKAMMQISLVSIIL